MGKNIIWSNDSPNRDAVEKYFKDDWINEVRAQFGLEASNESWIPSGLFHAVKEAALDSAIEKAVDRNEETINFVQAYRACNLRGLRLAGRQCGIAGSRRVTR